MTKELVFEYGGKSYTLAYTRATIREMEARGFVFDELSEKPVTRIPELFAGAFRKNHRDTEPETIDSIFRAFGDKEKLVAALVQMYGEAASSMMDEPDEKNAISWVKSW